MVRQSFSQASLNYSLVPGFAEEFVLDEDRDDKHDGSLDGHGTEVPSHHLPAERVLETILT